MPPRARPLIGQQRQEQPLLLSSRSSGCGDRQSSRPVSRSTVLTAFRKEFCCADSKEIQVAAATKLGVGLEPIPINAPEDVDRALAAIEGNRPDALLVNPTPVLQLHSQAVIAVALKQRLPRITGISQMGPDGILLSYASDQIQSWRMTADYVDRVLRGAKPPTRRSSIDQIRACDQHENSMRDRSGYPNRFASPCRRGYRVGDRSREIEGSISDPPADQDRLQI